MLPPSIDGQVYFRLHPQQYQFKRNITYKRHLTNVKSAMYNIHINAICNTSYHHSTLLLYLYCRKPINNNNNNNNNNSKRRGHQYRAQKRLNAKQNQIHGSRPENLTKMSCPDLIFDYAIVIGKFVF